MSALDFHAAGGEVGSVPLRLAGPDKGPRRGLGGPEAPQRRAPRARSASKPGKNDDDRGITVVDPKQDAKTKLKKPKLWKVLLHNDNYTTRDFVVYILQTVFGKGEPEAVRIMLHVHNSGIGVAGIYTYEVAETKLETTISLARQNEFPLMASMEPAEGNDE